MAGRRKARRFTTASSRRWRACWAALQARSDGIRLGPPRARDCGSGSVAALIVSATPLAAQDISINFGQGAARGGLNERTILADRAADGAVARALDSGDNDLRLFVDMSGEAQPQKPDDLSMRALVPAFMISELKRAFEIGFLLLVPFL